MNKSEIDQIIAHLRDVLPPCWWGIYRGCLSTGFDQAQSFALTQSYVLATATGNFCMRPDNPYTKEKEEN